jgi:hypothetical protein
MKTLRDLTFDPTATGHQSHENAPDTKPLGSSSLRSSGSYL